MKHEHMAKISDITEYDPREISCSCLRTGPQEEISAVKSTWCICALTYIQYSLWMTPLWHKYTFSPSDNVTKLCRTPSLMCLCCKSFILLKWISNYPFKKISYIEGNCNVKEYESIKCHYIDDISACYREVIHVFIYVLCTGVPQKDMEHWLSEEKWKTQTSCFVVGCFWSAFVSGLDAGNASDILNQLSQLSGSAREFAQTPLTMDKGLHTDSFELLAFVLKRADKTFCMITGVIWIQISSFFHQSVPLDCKRCLGSRYISPYLPYLPYPT